MDAPTLDITALRRFVALAAALTDAAGDSASFGAAVSAAAHRSGCGEAEMLASVAGLERQLGQRLLAEAGGPAITPAGDALLRAARRLVALHDEAVRDVAAVPAVAAATSPAPPEPVASAARSDAEHIRTLLADAIGCISEGFVLFDEAGRLVLCNDRYRAAYPLLQDVLRPGARFADILHTAVARGAAGESLADPAGWVAERLRRHMASEEATDHRLGDGRWYRISEHATGSGGIVKILTDITELKRHETALAQSELRHRQLVETAPYGIVVWDGVQVRFANAAAAALLGTDDPAAMPAAPMVDASDPDPAVPLFARLPRPGLAAAPGAPLEARLLGRDGAIHEVEVGVHPFELEDRPAWFLVFADVTQRKKAERALQQSQKMQAIGQLAGGIAHEFNNMLTAIGGFAQMARRAPNDRTRLGQCLDEIVKASDRAAGLTGQLLSFARSGTAEAARPVRVADQLDELRRFMRPVLGERYRLEIDARAADAVVLVEPALLHQSLVNLVINSRDAMPAGGPITVTLDRLSSADAAFWLRHADMRRGPLVTIAVTDAGTGIDPALLDRVFEPFFTTKAPGEGTGLGLSLVYSAATRAAGTVKVASSVGRGTTVTVYLPALAGAPAPAGTGPEPAGPLDGEGPDAADGDAAPGPGGRVEPIPSMAATVLLVEDEQQVREFIRLTLEDMGMRVVAVADGDAALGAFAAAGGAFDLLVTDLVMPGLGGAEVARRLRRECPDLPVLLISGYPPEKENLDDLLADTRRVAFLHKPIDPDALGDRIGALVV